MKRQRNTVEETTANRAAKRSEQAKEETPRVIARAEEGRRSRGEEEGCGVGADDTARYGSHGWWPWVGGAVDIEQMSWGLVWLPYWDLNCMGKAYDALYSDVVWDDDLWNLKSINEVPKTLQSL